MKIGIYEVIELLGDGGMGSVYRCRDPRFDRQVAVKVLHPHFQRNPDVALRFKTEAVVQAKLSHPHIVTLFDFLADDERLAIVMELVEGPSAETLVDRQGPLAVPRGMRLFEQVLEAIGYAHSRELIHRDIKPSNVLVEQVGSTETAKVVDFGIAKIVGSDRQRTATTAKLGTLAYMSPEQVRNPRAVDIRSDVYSLGATLQQLLTGTLPFDAESDFEVMRAILEAAPTPPLVDGRRLPTRIEQAIQKALLRNPDQRFQTCKEFLDALRGGEISLPLGSDLPQGTAPGVVASAPPPLLPAARTAGQPRVASPRHPQAGSRSPVRSAVLATLVVGLLLVAAGGFVWLKARSGATPPDPAPPPVPSMSEQDVAKARLAQEVAEERLRHALQTQATEATKRQERERAEEANRARRESEEAARRSRARDSLENALQTAQAERRSGDLDNARRRLQSARRAVPEDLKADLDGSLATVQEVLAEIDREVLEQEGRRRAVELDEAARRSVFEGQLSVARGHLAKRRFPEAKSLTEDLLEQADLPADLRDEARALLAQADNGLKSAWTPARVEAPRQSKRKPPNPRP